MFEPIAIVGSSCVLPGITNTEELWRVVINKEEKFIDTKVGRGGFVREFAAHKIAHEFLLESEVDELYLWALSCAREVLQKAKRYSEEKAISASVILANLSYPTRGLVNYAAKAWGISENKTSDFERFSSSMPAMLIKQRLRLQGEAYSIDAACASSLYALAQGCERLQARKDDFVLVGGLNRADDIFIHLGFKALQALSTSGHARVFCQEADGLVPAQGCAFVGLMRLEDALSLQCDISGVIRGFGLSNDGKAGGFLNPSKDGQLRAISQAYKKAEIDPNLVRYIECHGTGTKNGDATELKTCEDFFVAGKNREDDLILGSIKANIGHTITAAGLVGILKVSEAFAYGLFPPHLYSDVILPPGIKVLAKAEKWDLSRPQIAGVSAFGFGGNNAHVIVESLESYMEFSKFKSINYPSTCEVCLIKSAVYWGKENEKVPVSLKFIKTPPKDIELILPQQLAFFKVASEVLVASQINFEKVAIIGGFEIDPATSRFVLQEIYGNICEPLNATSVLGAMPNMLVNRINRSFDCKEASFTISALSKTGSLGLELAQSLLANNPDIEAVLLGCSDFGDREVGNLACKNMGMYPQKEGAVAVLVIRSLEASILNKELDLKFRETLCSSYLLSLLEDIEVKKRINMPGKTSNELIFSQMNAAPTMVPPIFWNPYRKKPFMDLEQIKKHSLGEFSKAFGPEFSDLEKYKQLVRMPTDPLLLVDTVLSIEAKSKDLGTGKIITESLVKKDSWYELHGHMPAGILVESGQADLILISYQGVDFWNKGEKVYRLLGCDLTFHRDLPRIGETLTYSIETERYVANSKDVRLTFFRYDCLCNGEKMLTMRNGQAGFFTLKELAETRGVQLDRQILARDLEDVKAHNFNLQSYKTSLNNEEVTAFANGDYYKAFGFENFRNYTRPPQICNSNMLLIDEVTEISANGGMWGNGCIHTRSNINPECWFFKGHFINDPCMPGTLMFEGALQVLGVFLAAMGACEGRDGWRFQPVCEKTVRLICRGQVSEKTKKLEYQAWIRKLDLGTKPQVVADVICFADGLKAFYARTVSLELVPDWPMAKVERYGAAYCSPSGFVFDEQAFAAIASGRPSLAMGESYSLFDDGRAIPRLPSPPFLFCSRVVGVIGELWNCEAGVEACIEYDVPDDAWYFKEGGNNCMPFSVLLEVGLQACGWLAFASGAALAVKDKTCFRNLSGIGSIQLLPQQGTVKKIRSIVRLTTHSKVGSTIIQRFDVKCEANSQILLDVSTEFGFFTSQALSQQSGLYVPCEHESLFKLKNQGANIDLQAMRSGSLHLGHERYAVLDTLEIFSFAGKDSLLGYKQILPDAWFFKLHFFQDPVQPGSIGLECFVEMIKAYLLHRCKSVSKQNTKFNLLNFGSDKIKWKYRGQVLPRNKDLVCTFIIRDFCEEEFQVLGDGYLWIDGKAIYECLGIKIGMDFKDSENL